MRLADLKFDAVFCINLERRKDRRMRVGKEIERMGLPVTWYDAIDNKNMALAHASGTLKPGMMGCYLSHFFLLQYALMQNMERILILEDDAQFITGAEGLLRHALPVLPQDWQFAYLGYCMISGEKIRKVNDFWIVPGGSWGTQGYMINGREAIQRVLQGLKRVRNQIDIQLSFNTLPRSGLKYYAITPSCIRQRASNSDVQ